MLIDAADADGDGNIDYEEFGNMLFERTKKLHKRSIPKNAILRESLKRRKFCTRHDSEKSVEISQGIANTATMGSETSIMTAIITALGVLFITVNIVLVYIKD